MHIKTEANKSSKIEGTKTSIEEVLLQGVRGKHKTPGEFRRSQNWIGGTMPSNALYVPPSILDMPELLSYFEKFINNDDIKVPHLIKIALLHYQFETIHPFLDGNGRIGRLIIPLYLLNKGVLDKSCFYISDFLEKNRAAYYEGLERVRTKNDISHWIKFFLTASIYTAKTAKSKFKKVVELVNQLNKDVFEIKGRPENTIRVLEAFYDMPILSGKQLQEITGLSQPTVDAAIRGMLEKNILKEITGYNRNRIYSLYKYLDIFVYKKEKSENLF